jgi:site-specific DNA-cytosine methylase
VLSVVLGDLFSTLLVVFTAKLWRDFSPRSFSKKTLSEMFKYAIEKKPVGCRLNNIHIKEPQVLKMRRTDEEKLRRHNFGDGGAKFRSGSKYYDIGENCCANTVTTVMKDNILIEPKSDNKDVEITLDNIDKYIKVRYFTPRENFRLMDVDDVNIDKIMSVTSKSQCLKLAGNSIVVSVLYHIFKKMFIEKSYKISLF